MFAVVMRDGAVFFEERPAPVPGPRDLLVRVEAAGMNGADMMQLRGHYPAPEGVAPDIPGLEITGVVEALGGSASMFAVGDRVMGLVPGAGQAEFALLDERVALAVPSRLSPAEAGGFVETFATAHDALFVNAGLKAGERLLITGAAGGVGTAAIQLARIRGATVVASVRSSELRDPVGRLGADAIDPGEVEKFGPYDVILELVGGKDVAPSVNMLDIGGRIVVIGVGAGVKTELNLLAMMARRASITGSMLRSRTIDEKADVALGVARDVLPLAEAGSLQVPIAATYRFVDVRDAYQRFAAGTKFGKVVLVAS